MNILHIACIDRTIFHFRLKLLNELKLSGFVTHVAAKSTNQNYSKIISGHGHVFHDIDINRNISPYNILKGINDIRRIIRDNNIEMVHTHTPIGGAIGRIAANKENVKIVFHTTGGWYFHENMNKLKHFLFVQIEKYLARKTNVIFSVNHEDIETAKYYNIATKNEIVYSGPAGVNLDRFKSCHNFDKNERKSSFGYNPHCIIVGMIGRLVWEKGYKEFIECVELFITNNSNSPIKFIIIGDGPDSELIKNYADKLSVSQHIDFLGYRNDIPDLLLIMDIFLFPSHREGVPVGVQEAMISKLPVIAFNIRGCRELICNNKSGFIVPYIDVQKMYEKLKILFYNADLRIKFGEKGYSIICEGYLDDLHVNRQMDFYNKNFINSIYDKVDN